MKKPVGVLTVALVASMSFAGVALAEEVDDEPESQIVAPVVIVDEENGLVTIAIPVDGELPEGCLPEDPAEPGDPEEPDEDAAEGGEKVTDDEAAVSYGPGDCIEFVIDHPSGKTHHGAVVSTVAKNLHPSMLDGIKKGEIMRWVAKTGKIADGDDGGDDDDDNGEVKVKREKKEKKDKLDKSDKTRGKSDKAKNKENPGRANSNRGHKNG